jgi:hypothetical protein
MRLSNLIVTARGGLMAMTVIALMLAGCNGSTEETADPGPSEPAVTTTVATDVTTETTSETTEPAPAGETPIDLTLADVFEPIATDPTEAGPRPLLAWEPVDGAAEYQVVVLGADGEPYWAWSGTETMINVGGNAEPLAIGAWVHESMTWTVSAHAPDGEVLGLSAPAGLEP